jgi:type IV pilus biogenesis protein CpaD/CtpE
MLNKRSPLFAALVLALPLAGCAMTGSLFEEEAMTPYGGSKQHPIKVQGGQASVENCGLWPEDLANTTSNEMAYNHGCAVQSNIAAMTAYPNDLVRMRRMGPKPAFNRVKAISDMTSTDTATASPAAPAAGSPVAAGP